MVLVSIVIAALAAVGACWAAWEARRSAEATRKAAEAPTFSGFFAEYFDPSMSQALRALAAWRESHGDTFARDWLSALRTGAEDATRVDAARRSVKGYFHRAIELHLAGLLDLETTKAICYVNGVNVYYDVVDPLELELNPERASRAVDFLRVQVARYREGEHVASIPP